MEQLWRKKSQESDLSPLNLRCPLVIQGEVLREVDTGAWSSAGWSRLKTRVPELASCTGNESRALAELLNTVSKDLEEQRSQD